MKVWEKGEAEPENWLLQRTEDFAAPETGSMYLNAHYFDVTFGDFQVTEIEGNDILPGKNSSDTLIAVDTGQTNPGIGETDVFTGGAGDDVFVFGDASGAFYDNGDDATAGEEDFGLIWDFESGGDQIQLSGSEDDYELADAPASIASGTGIYLINGGGGPNELIGVVNGASGLSLTGDDFIYQPTAVA
jgi:hypothetical protein